jgi:hypothetical protein
MCQIGIWTWRVGRGGLTSSTFSIIPEVVADMGMHFCTTSLVPKTSCLLTFIFGVTCEFSSKKIVMRGVVPPKC